MYALDRLEPIHHQLVHLEYSLFSRLLWHLAALFTVPEHGGCVYTAW
jgi:hypothetical protein